MVKEGSVKEGASGAVAVLDGVVLSILVQGAVIATALFIYLRGPLYPPLGGIPAVPIALAIELAAFALGLHELTAGRRWMIRRIFLGWMIGFPIVAALAFYWLSQLPVPVQG